MLKGQASAHIIQNQMLFLGEVGGGGGWGGGVEGGDVNIRLSNIKTRLNGFAIDVLSGEKKTSQRTKEINRQQ